jgi:hypothetical protein
MYCVIRKKQSRREYKMLTAPLICAVPSRHAKTTVPSRLPATSTGRRNYFRGMILRRQPSKMKRDVATKRI